MRRIGLYASTLSLLVMLVAACGAPAVAPVEEAAPTAAAPAEAAAAPAAEGSADAAAPGEYHEAPQLAELVAAAVVERAVGQLADQISQDGIGRGNHRSSASLRSMQPIRAIRSRRSTIFTAATVFRSPSAIAAIDVPAP